MSKFLYWIPVILLLISCSKEDNPINGEEDHTATGFLRGNVENASWFADKIQAYKQSSIIYITGTQKINNSSAYTSSILNFKIINISQTGTFGIGEDEPGFKYFVKASYTLKSAGAAPDKKYTAYYRDYSVFDMSRIDDKGLDATFIFVTYSQDFLDSVNFTSGVIKIDY